KKLAGLKETKTKAKSDEKDNRDQQQARAAVALLRLEQGEKVWGLLQHSSDPSVRSYMVNWLKPLGTGYKTIKTKLESLHNPISDPESGKSSMEDILVHLETSQRRALILALGEYNTEDFAPDDLETLVNRLLERYRYDPDAGVHGAAESTLRHWKKKAVLEQAHSELPKLKDLGDLKEMGDRRWYVNCEGQTFSVINGPVRFKMGSPPSEPGHRSGESQHYTDISRSFALATKEVTVEEFERFLKANPKIRLDNTEEADSGTDGPRISVNWCVAA